MTRTAIASHRGGAYLWPENSTLACRNALALPVEQLEIDVHLSADGEVVVIHDSTLDRTTDSRGEVRGMTAAALGAVRVRGTGGEAVPMLDAIAALTRAAGQVLRLEIKGDRQGRVYPGIVPRCRQVLGAAGMLERTILIAFQPLVLAEAARLGGFRQLGLLLETRAWRGMGPEIALALARACGAEEIGLDLADWDEAAVAAVRQGGLGTSAWGVNGEAAVARGLALGLDVITSDDPAQALRQRDAGRGG